MTSILCVEPTWGADVIYRGVLLRVTVTINITVKAPAHGVSVSVIFEQTNWNSLESENAIRL